MKIDGYVEDEGRLTGRFGDVPVGGGPVEHVASGAFEDRRLGAERLVVDVIKEDVLHRPGSALVGAVGKDFAGPNEHSLTAADNVTKVTGRVAMDAEGRLLRV